MIADPVATPAPTGTDARSIAKRAIQSSDENALRLLISWCNYDIVRRAYAGLKGPSTEPRCAALKEYLA